MKPAPSHPAGFSCAGGTERSGLGWLPPKQSSGGLHAKDAIPTVAAAIVALSGSVAFAQGSGASGGVGGAAAESGASTAAPLAPMTEPAKGAGTKSMKKAKKKSKV